jgi:DNA invertase Pin-like site-specific DNA recombinase
MLPQTEEDYMDAAAYIRVSTDEQAGKDRLGLDAQRELIRDYATQHDLKRTLPLPFK